MSRGHLLPDVAKRPDRRSAIGQQQRRRQVHHRWLLCEALEDRRLLSISLLGTSGYVTLVNPAEADDEALKIAESNGAMITTVVTDDKTQAVLADTVGESPESQIRTTNYVAISGTT